MTARSAFETAFALQTVSQVLGAGLNGNLIARLLRELRFSTMPKQKVTAEPTS